MTYRNGWKEYLTTGVMFGVPMGIFFGINYWSVCFGVLGGLACGVLVTLLILLFCVVTEKKFDKLRVAIATERTVICDGGATVKGNGGWMFLTENALEFYPHKINISTKNIIIPLAEIHSVDIKKNQLLIAEKDGTVLPIVVSHVKEWKKQVDRKIG
jgi:hypothetical protein